MLCPEGCLEGFAIFHAVPHHMPSPSVDGRCLKDVVLDLAWDSLASVTPLDERSISTRCARPCCAQRVGSKASSSSMPCPAMPCPSVDRRASMWSVDRIPMAMEATMATKGDETMTTMSGCALLLCPVMA